MTKPTAVAKTDAPVAGTITRPIAMQTTPTGDAVLTIFGDIGFWGTTLDSLDEAVRSAGTVTSLTLRINSGGGDAFEGMGINAYLQSLPYPTTAEILGIAASAATIVALGCKTVKMPKAGQFMIHEARVPMLNADEADLTQSLAMIQSVNAAMVSVYAAKTGQAPEAIAAQMKATTWLSAEDALAGGFIDAISDADVVDPVASLDADNDELDGELIGIAGATASKSDDEDEDNSDDEDEDEDDNARDEMGRFASTARAYVEGRTAFAQSADLAPRILAHASTVFPAAADAAKAAELVAPVATAKPVTKKTRKAAAAATALTAAAPSAAPVAAQPVPVAPVVPAAIIVAVCPVAMAEACAAAGDIGFARQALKNGLSIEAAVAAIGASGEKLALAARFRAVATHIQIDDAKVIAAANLDEVRKIFFEALVAEEVKIDTAPQAAVEAPKAASEQLQASKTKINSRFFPGHRA